MRLWLRLPPTLPEPLHDLWITPVPHDIQRIMDSLEERNVQVMEMLIRAEYRTLAVSSAVRDQQRDAHATAPIPNRGEK